MSGGEYRLAGKTSPDWARQVADEPEQLLSDHAHCELKAAASAMSLLKRNPDRPGLAPRLSVLIKEECDHLQRVLVELQRRGASLAADEPSPYAKGLHRLAATSRGRGDVYVDALLVSALIEKRSHERFGCLLRCEALTDLHSLYRALKASEERHGDLFVDLALGAEAETVVARRWATLAAGEATLIESIPFAPRIHSGPPATG